jgi:IS5 family transposase
VDATVDWITVEELLIKYFQIKSDPELESQINDRISFKSFLKLPMDYPSPEHSTFSRFRKRLSKEAMIKINSELLQQFHHQDLSINEGVAVDAMLVKSANRPLSNKKIKQLNLHLDLWDVRNHDPP